MEIVGWTSLYIPYLDETYSIDELTYMFEIKYNIGKVKRIDMVRTVKKQIKTAFIHFDTWFLNDFTQFLRRELEMYGKYNLNVYATYLQNKIEKHSDCKACVNLYQHKLSTYVNENNINDITLLIHRTKYTHMHKYALLQEPTSPIKNRRTSSNNSLESEQLQVQSSNLQDVIDRHEKRIELLEDEIQVLVTYYTNAHNK
jgi:hypothetical protein